MPVIAPASGFGRIYQETAKAGISVTAGGVAHTMGTWTTLVDPIAYDVFGVALRITGVSGAATDTRMLADVGVGPTGGGSEQIVIPYLDVGAAGEASRGGKTWFFPLYIPAGKALRVRTQAVIVSDTSTWATYLYELPPHGFAEDAPQAWAQYGAEAASSSGAAVTSGNGTFGTAVDVTSGAGTSRAHRWFHVGIDWGTNTVVTSGAYRVRLSKDSAGNERLGVWDFTTDGGEMVHGPHPSFPVCCPCPAGTLLYVAVDGAAAEAMAAIVYAS